MKRIPSLDGFRALSIAIVIASHALGAAWVRNGLSERWYQAIDGAMGVFIFFVISGYLITTLLVREFDRSGHIDLRRFYLRRFLRIMPPVLVYILVIVATTPLSGIHPAPRDVFTAATLTQNLDPWAHSFVFEHFWSLCIEEQFYLLWPLPLLLLLRSKGRRGAISLTFFLIVLAPLYRLAIYPLVHNQPLRHYCDGLLPGQMDAILFGCWAALAQGSPGFERLYAHMTRAVVLLPLWYFGISQWLCVWLGNGYRLALGDTINGLAVVFMILWCIRNSESAAGRLLNWPPVVHLGVISYSVYIWQTYFLQAANPTVFGRLPLNLICILVCAELSWHTIERYSRVERDRWASAAPLSRQSTPGLS